MSHEISDLPAPKAAVRKPSFSGGFGTLPSVPFKAPRTTPKDSTPSGAHTRKPVAPKATRTSGTQKGGHGTGKATRPTPRPDRLGK